MIVRQAAHVIDLLEYFLLVKQPANLAAISTAMGWPRSSTFNLLTTLSQRGFLYEPRPRGGYYPSPKWISLMRGIAESEVLPEPLRAAVDGIVAATAETVVVAAPAGTQVVFMHVVESPAVVRFSAQVGDQMPMYATACGRALLSQYSDQERAALLKRIKFEKRRGWPANAGKVEVELERAQARGWHENIGGVSADLCGVSLPFALPGRRLSVAVAGPIGRVRERIPQIAATLKRELKRCASGLPS